MVKKIASAVVVVALIYVGGSYYVGHRATQAMSDMRANAQAQSNDTIAWENVQSNNGIFSSNGSMTMVYTTLTLDNGQPVKVNIDYTIHHALSFSHVAHHVWRASPDDALAGAMAALYPTPPSLTGDGYMQWSGVTTSSINFPGAQDRQTDRATVSFSPLAGTLVSGDNQFDMKLAVPNISIKDLQGPGSLTLSQLGYEVQSTDVTSGSARATLTLDEAVLVDEGGQPQTLKGYQWLFDFRYVNDVLSFDMDKTLNSLQVMGNEIDNLEFKLGIDGLHRRDLQQMANLYEQADGNLLSLSAAQQDSWETLVRGMLAKGITLRIPAVKANVKLMGSPSSEAIGVAGLTASAQITDQEQFAGHVRLALAELSTPEMFRMFVPQVRDFELDVTNQVTDGRSTLSVKKSLGSYEQLDSSVKDVTGEMTLSGVKSTDLLELLEIIEISGGDLDYLHPDDFDRLVEILYDAAIHGLTLEVPKLAGSGTMRGAASDSLVLEGLSMNIKIDDPQTGAGTASVALAQLAARGPQMAGMPQIDAYKLEISNQIIDGKVKYQIEKSVQSYKDDMIEIGPSVVAMNLSGLSAEDVERFADLGEYSFAYLDDDQFEELMQLARNAIEGGFELSIPTLDISLDQAKVQGQASLSLTGLAGAPLASFDLNRLGQMQIKLAVTGQSPWVTPFVEQGVAMGFVTPVTDGAQAELVFKDGQLVFNGQAMPADEFVTFGNMMVQEMLVDTE